jgi:hypothetical protein
LLVLRLQEGRGVKVDPHLNEANLENNMNRLIAAIIVISSLSACASTPKEPPMTRIADDTLVRLSVIEPNSETPNVSKDGGMYAKNISAGALGGAGMGAAYGLMAGFACGPMVVICGPAGMIGGAMGGTIFGMAFGTFSAASLQLPQEKAEALDAIVAKTYADTVMTDVLSDRFKANGETHWSFVDDGEAVSITLVLNGIGMKKEKKDHLTITVASTLVVETGSGDSVSVEERQFTSASRSEHVDYWIADGGENLNEQLELSISETARRMANILKSYTKPYGRPESQEEFVPPPAKIETITAGTSADQSPTIR